MPFAVFRRHQRKLLAIFAILAMVGFVLADSLPSLLRGGPDVTDDEVVVELFGKPVRRSELMRLAEQRGFANAFMLQARLANTDRFFGDTNTRALVDALILQHKADELGMPASAELAKRWLRVRPSTPLTTARFNEVYHAGFADRMTDEQLLAAIANQIRLFDVRLLPGMPEVTPLDVFRYYRDQNERVAADLVPVAVENFISQVKDPSDAEVRAYYDRFKAILPDPDRPTPGFMVPRKVQVESVMSDSAALTAAIRLKLNAAEVREFYNRRQADFPAPTPELPVDIFAGDPQAKLTPHVASPLAEVRPLVEMALAEEKAREEIDRHFDPVRDEMTAFSESYSDAQEANQEATTQGQAARDLPTPKGRIKPIAAREGLVHEITPLMTHEEAERHLPIALARTADGRPFVEVVFDSRRPVYDPIDLADDRGRRYLAWKLADQPPRVPKLEEVRPEVVHAWKIEQARGLAEKAAKDLAEQARKAGGDLRAAAGTRPVVATDPIPRLMPGMPSMGQFGFSFGPPRPSELIQVPHAGPAFLEAYFGLQPKAVVVEPNAPKTVYYVMTLRDRQPAEFQGLYGLRGPYASMAGEVAQDELIRRDQRWMAELRREAGLRPDWVPADERKDEAGVG
jgi:hypothetical protein